MIFSFLKKTKPSKVLKNNIISDNEIKEELKNKGYSIAKIESDFLKKLTLIFEQNHSFNEDVGSMFYSVYSQNIHYRRKINIEIDNILKPFYDNLFNNYKTVLNSFIVKTPGKGSEFQPHQDSTGLDETIYSPLSIWIPLDDVNESNGCIFLIPKSHHLAPIYRGISMKPNFESIKNEIREFFVPIPLKKGEILIFDNRLIHTSSENISGKDRIVVMSGIFPKEARLISCYLDKKNNEIEIYEQLDDFLIENKNFYFNCTERPYLGTLIKKVPNDINELKISDFKKLKLEKSEKSTFLKFSETNFYVEPA